MNETLWIRTGDTGEYESFGNDFGALVEHLQELHAGPVESWIDGPGVGFATANFPGHNLISCYWGDADADLVRPLDAAERAIVEAGLNVDRLNRMMLFEACRAALGT